MFRPARKPLLEVGGYRIVFGMSESDAAKTCCLALRRAGAVGVLLATLLMACGVVTTRPDKRCAVAEGLIPSPAPPHRGELLALLSDDMLRGAQGRGDELWFSGPGTWVLCNAYAKRSQCGSTTWTFTRMGASWELAVGGSLVVCHE